VNGVAGNHGRLLTATSHHKCIMACVSTTFHQRCRSRAAVAQIHMLLHRHGPQQIGSTFSRLRSDTCHRLAVADNAWTHRRRGLCMVPSPADHLPVCSAKADEATTSTRSPTVAKVIVLRPAMVLADCSCWMMMLQGGPRGVVSDKLMPHADHAAVFYMRWEA
jgi:hypothetical protein